MKVSKTYEFSETELRKIFRDNMQDLIQDTLDPEYIAKMIADKPNRLNWTVEDLLAECDVMYLPVPKTFREVVELFAEQWWFLDMFPEISKDCENSDIDIRIIIRGDSDCVVLTKAEIMENIAY